MSRSSLFRRPRLRRLVPAGLAGLAVLVVTTAAATGDQPTEAAQVQAAADTEIAEAPGVTSQLQALARVDQADERARDHSHRAARAERERARASAAAEARPTPVSGPEPEPTSEPEPEPAARSHWDELADCESGEWDADGNPVAGSARWNYGLAAGEDGTFEGGLQFHPATWDGFRSPDLPGHAGEASRAQQIAVAEQVRAAQGWGAWPACSRKIGLR